MRRNKSAFLWVCLAIVVGVAGRAAAEDAKEITCTGKVVDAQKKPLEGAKVALYVYTRQINSFSYGISPAEQVTTGSDGGFSLSVLADSDNYINGYVIAEKEGFALGWSRWDMRKGSVELELELGVPNTLAGVVVDENDKPVPAAQVRIYMLLKNKQYLISPFAPTLLSTDTDAEGKFAFANLPLETKADFLVGKKGYANINSWTTSSRLNYAVGQTDIKLVLPVEARIEGIVVEKKTGKSAAGIRLIVWEKNRWAQNAFDSKDDGTFSVKSLAPGKYKLELLPPGTELADWIAEPVEVLAEKGKTTSGVRIELIKGGLLEFVVTDAVSGKSLDKVSVSVGNEVCNRSALSGKDGIALIRLIPGEYYLFGAYRQDYSPNNSEDAVVIADGKTERWEYALFPESKITGIVRDEKGTPLEGATLMVWPAERQQEVVANAGGKFEVVYDMQNLSSGEIPVLLLCRYEEGNLAAALEIDGDTRTLDVELKSGSTFIGKVVDPDGKGIEGAKLRVDLCKPGLSWPIVPTNPTRNETTTDEEGRFEIKAVPAGHEYSLSTKAKGYGNKRTEEIDTNDAVDNQLDMGNITLALANLSISGVVVDDSGKPVADVTVNTYSSHQPYHVTKTDADGIFTFEGVCAGRILILAGKLGTPLGGSVDTEVGAANIKIVISEKSSSHRYVPKQPASLVGKSLPELKDLKIELPPADLNNKRVLICFWDMNQRPSRNCIIQLAKQAEQLKNNDLTVVAIQSSKVDEKALNEWMNEHNVLFPVGMVQGDQENVRLSWGVQSLPWLILTDKEHIVRAEGFAVAELDQKVHIIKNDEEKKP